MHFCTYAKRIQRRNYYWNKCFKNKIGLFFCPYYYTGGAAQKGISFTVYSILTRQFNDLLLLMFNNFSEFPVLGFWGVFLCISNFKCSLRQICSSSVYLKDRSWYRGPLAWIKLWPLTESVRIKINWQIHNNHQSYIKHLWLHFCCFLKWFAQFSFCLKPMIILCFI